MLFTQLLQWTARLHYPHHRVAPSVIIQYLLFPVHMQVTFQCDDGLFPEAEGIMTATCLAIGEWDQNPVEILCSGKCSHYLK